MSDQSISEQLYDHVSAGRENEFFRLLALHPSSRTWCTMSGQTLLMSASCNGREGCVAALLLQSPDEQVESRRLDGVNALMLVCRGGQLGIMKRLLRHSPTSQLTCRGLDNLDAAAICATEGHEACTQYLMEHWRPTAARLDLALYATVKSYVSAAKQTAMKKTAMKNVFEQTDGDVARLRMCIKLLLGAGPTDFILDRLSHTLVMKIVEGMVTEAGGAGVDPNVRQPCMPCPFAGLT
jgi:hypothetical protein